MKFSTYLRYFFYLGFNWNWRIAFTIIAQEIKGEKKYNINTTGADELDNIEAAGIDISHATIYMPISYVLLEEIFKQLPKPTGTHFLDIGCGKGRGMCLAAHNGFTKLTGIDISAPLCQEAIENLAQTKEKLPALQYKVITKDAMNYEIPADVDCIFLFNPFDVVIMSAVVYNIMESVQDYPRDITVIYANPLYEDLFLEEGFTEIYHTKEMKYLEAGIYELKSAVLN